MPITIFVAAELTEILSTTVFRLGGSMKVCHTIMLYLSGWTNTTSPGMPISEESILILLEKQPAVTSASLSASLPRTVRHCICLRVLLICYPMLHWSSETAVTGSKIIWYLWQVSTNRKRICRKVRCPLP